MQGEDFPMAMHFLHKSASSQLVVVVVLFRLGAENEALAALLPHMPSRGEPERVVTPAMADPGALLPSGRGYYAYDGSDDSPALYRGRALARHEAATGLVRCPVGYVEKPVPGQCAARAAPQRPRGAGEPVVRGPLQP